MQVAAAEANDKAQKAETIAGDTLLDLEKANSQLQRCHDEIKVLQGDRDTAKGALRTEFDRANAVIKLLMIQGGPFGVTMGAIEAAASAVSKGKEARDAWADMLHDRSAGTNT